MRLSINTIVMTALLMLSLFTVGHTCFAQKPSFTTIDCPGGFTVNSLSGFVNLSRTDLNIPNRSLPLDFTFVYNSGKFNRDIGYGRGWTFHFANKYRTDSLGIRVLWGAGREDLYTQEGSDFSAPEGVFNELVPLTASAFKIVQKDGTTYFFEDDVHKRVTKIADRNNNELLFTYTDSLVTQIADGNGRSIALAYTAGRLSSITDELESPTRTITYTYDAAGNLLTVTDPEGHSRSYGYFPNGPMNTYTDRNENVINLVYNNNHTLKEIISCVARKSFSYSRESLSTFVTDYRDDGVKIRSTYRHDAKGNLLQMQGSCCGYQREFEYNDQNLMTKSTDANGNATAYTWDEKGNLLTITDALGNTSTYTYEPNFSLLASYTDRNGNQTTYGYDANGNLTSANFPEGVNNSYTYNGKGDMLSMTDGRGNVTQYIFDLFGNLVEADYPLGMTYLFAQNIRGYIQHITDSNGGITAFQYDISGRLTKIIDALGNEADFVYDGNDNLTNFTDRNGNSEEFVFDAADRMVKRIDALGFETKISHDNLDNVVAISDRNSNTTNYKYDERNLLIGISNALNESTSLEYDASGNLTAMVQPNGNTYSYQYDALNRLINVHDQLGDYLSMNYDQEGNLTTRSLPEGQSIQLAYDGLNRVTQIIDELGNIGSLAYDANFNIVQETDRKGNAATRTYDALDRMIDLTDQLGNTIQFEYNTLGDMTALTDQNGNSTLYGYDLLSRNINKTYADGTSESFEYDNEGYLTQLTDRNGIVTSYVYSPVYNLLSRSSPGNNSTYGYDPQGRKINASNENASLAFQYDAANRLTSETLNNKTTQYFYDIANSLSGEIYPSGRIIERSFDPRFRLMSISDDDVTVAMFNYDNSDRLIQCAYPVNGTSSNYLFNESGALVSHNVQPGNVINSLFNYDNNGNKVSELKLHNPDRSETFDYDVANKLVAFLRGPLVNASITLPNHSESFNYDATGNRTSVSKNEDNTLFNPNNVNAYASITGFLSDTYTYDLNGNLTTTLSRTFHYNSDNQITAISGDITASYKYDPFGRRIEKNVDGNIEKYFYSINDVIEIYSSDDFLLESRIYGSETDDILQVRKNGSDFYYHKDQLKSVIAISDIEGVITERYEYSPFGAVTIYDENFNIRDESIIGNDLLFTGRQFDIESGLYYYRARYMEPHLGRFIQVDPLGYLGGDANLYAYVGNRPTFFTDPFGLKCHKPSPGRGAADDVPPHDMGIAAAEKLATSIFKKNAEKIANKYLDVFAGEIVPQLKTGGRIVTNVFNKVGPPIAVYGAYQKISTAYSDRTIANAADAYLAYLGAVASIATTVIAAIVAVKGSAYVGAGGLLGASIIGGIFTAIGVLDTISEVMTGKSVAQNTFGEKPISDLNPFDNPCK